LLYRAPAYHWGGRLIVYRIYQIDGGVNSGEIGADEVIHPEKEMAQRTAVKYSAQDSFD